MVPVLSYVHELCTTKIQESKTQATKIGSLKGVRSYSKLDHTRNEDIKELPVFDLKDRLNDCMRQ